MLVAGSKPNKIGFFYGWVIVAAVFVILATTSGLGFYNASVILSAAVGELGSGSGGSSVGAISGATGLFFAVSGLTGFALSRWIDTVDIRAFFVSGGLLGAGALYGLRWVDSVPKLYVFFALFGIGFGAGGLVPGTTLVTRWFDKRRSVALSIASTGLSVGGIALTPTAARLIEERGLAHAGSILAIGWLVGTIPLALLFLRSRPAELGLRPDGGAIGTGAGGATDGKAEPELGGVAVSGMGTGTEQGRLAAGKGKGNGEGDGSVDGGGKGPQTTSAVQRPDGELGASFAEARSSRFYWAVCGGYGLIFFGQVGALAQLYNMAKERTDAVTAARCLSALALASVVARLLGGFVVLRVPTKAFTAMLTIVQALALLFLSVALSRFALLAGSVAFGVSIGNLLMLQPLLLAEAFGVAHYSRIYSFSQLIGTAGVAGGPLALGLIRDSYDYRTAFVVAATATLCGFVAVTAAGPTKVAQAIWKPVPALSK